MFSFERNPFSASKYMLVFETILSLNVLDMLFSESDEQNNRSQGPIDSNILVTELTLIFSRSINLFQ